MRYVESVGRGVCFYLNFRLVVIGDRDGMNCLRNKRVCVLKALKMLKTTPN